MSADEENLDLPITIEPVETRRGRSPPDKEERVCLMERFLVKTDAQPVAAAAMRLRAGDELQRFLDIRAQVFALIAEADRLAAIIRKEASSG